MKQSCMLRNSRLLRLAQVEVGEEAPDARSTASRTSGCSIWLNQPMNRVAQPARNAVGQQEVEVLLLTDLERAATRIVIELSTRLRYILDPMEFGATTTCALCGRRRRAGGVAGQAEGAAGAVAGQAPVADRACAHGAADRRAGAVLRVRRGATFFRADDAPDEVAARRRAGFMRLAELYRSASPRRAALTAEAAERHLRPAVHRRLPRAVPVQPLRAPAPEGRRVRAVVRRRDAHRPRRQPLLRPDRLVRRQRLRLRLLQGLHRSAAASGVRELGPVLGAYHPVVADNVRAAARRSPASTRCRSTCPAPRR